MNLYGSEGPSPGRIAHNNDILTIMAINPTAIFDKEEVISDLGTSIIGLSETSATREAMRISTNRFRKAGVNTKWSQPVEAHACGTGQLRGRAAGVAIVSHFGIRKSVEPLPCDIVDSKRYVEAYVNVGPRATIKVITLYGPPQGGYHRDHHSITERLMLVAAERSAGYRGFAIIIGDLNLDCEDLAAWQTLKAKGWVDTAKVVADR